MNLDKNRSKALHVSGTQLMDDNDHPIQLRGISTHGIGWYPDYVNQELFHEFRQDWGMNVVRLAMYTDEPQGYCTDGDQAALKELICRGVEYATAEDLYVIIDWHILADYNPHMNKEAAKDFFQEMSEKFGSYDNVIYELCNEPNGDTSWEEIKSYAEEIIPIIRKNARDAVIIVGTPTWSQDVDIAAKNPISEYGNIMYALHFYAGTHKQGLRDKMAKAMEEGLPVFVSEYGICDASGNGDLDLEEAARWTTAMEEAKVSYIMWNLSNKDESSAILKKTSTRISAFTEEDLSQGGIWLKQMLSK